MEKSEGEKIPVDYLISLPERSLRALAALVGGVSVFLADTLLPDALRGTTIYKLIIGDTQRFLIERVAQMELQGQSFVLSQEIPENFVQRKAAGTVLEAVGLLAFHFSPMWVFAIVGDVSAGSKIFLERLMKHLKDQGVIPEEAVINDLVDLVEATQAASRASVKAVDTPPLSRKELDGLVGDLKRAYRMVFLQVPGLTSHLEDLWMRMEKISERESISLAELSGVMSIQLANMGRKGVETMLAVGKSGSELFGEEILHNYKETLDLISKYGAKEYLRQYMAPFVETSLRHFQYSRESWIEQRIRKRNRNSE
ncbi:MAG: hypothetical protein A2Z14_16080 [Chloroflexi bacterium RBG_16_48_8]|nr:MAG: hypothetical protein A2Z14_16080 [Chloroflexi bacterium RBG_16_48_8]